MLDWSHIKVLGRTSRQAGDTLFWSGSRYEMNVKAANLTVHIEAAYGSQEQWIAVTLNRVLVCRMPLLRGDNEIILFRNRNAEETKNVRIIKEVQPMGGDGASYIRLTDIETDGELLPVEEPSLRLQFVGDSITSGEGAIGARSEQDWVAQLFSAYDNYTYKTAEALHADYQVISQSGWGVYCGYNNDIHMNVPSLYDHVCSLITVDGRGVRGSTKRYDYRRFEPDYVIVNLGTNDFGACAAEAYIDPDSGKSYRLKKGDDGRMDEESRRLFSEAVTKFLTKLRKAHPGAFLVWVYGMLGQELAEPIARTIDAYRESTKDAKVDFLLLPDTTEDAFGARSHPGQLSHERAAATIVQYVSEKEKGGSNGRER